MDANWHGKDLLIDASILDGQLHGIYNEYDLTTGKIKIYCNYRNGQLDGKKTIYFYSKDGSLNYKKTEEWKGGILIEAASY
jgi:antitoxin component YwqK of YwqJK toxin-antitoxin module